MKTRHISRIFLLMLLLHCLFAQQQADPDYDTSVPVPTFTVDKPVLLFDEGHNNFHTTTGRYQPFADLMRNDGYDVTPLSQSVTESALSQVDVYVIANAMGNSDANDAPAFTIDECNIISTWVREGGSLLLIADHYPFGDAAQTLGDAFGIHFQKGLVWDSIHYDTTSGDDSQLIFSKENQLLRQHAITKDIDKVITFTGQSIQCTDSCFSFLTLSPHAVDMTASRTISRDGEDIRVQVDYINPVSAYGRSQGIAMQHGKGRIVVLGEAAMLTAQKRREGGMMGMNYHQENKQLAINIMHWLSEK